MSTVYSLSELNSHIRQTMEDAYPDPIWVSAEIASFNQNAFSGHCYLELVDADGRQARSKAMIWKKTNEIIRTKFEVKTGQKLQQGLKVQVLVKVEFNIQYGLSLIVWDIDPDYTLGELAKKRALVVKRLQENGLDQLNKSLKLEGPIQRVAIISSPTAAGYQDFITHLSENDYGFAFHFELFPALMQGVEAIPSIIQAFEQVKLKMNAFQVVAFIRGGGSTTDLQIFDEYAVAEAVARCPLPVFSGIGHQRDESVSDLVANSSFKTPTAVADWLISALIQYDFQATEQIRFISQTLSFRLNELANGFESVHFQLSRRFFQKTQSAQTDSQKVFSKLNSSFQKAIFGQKEQFQHLEAQIDLGNPLTILKKGFARVSQSGKWIKQKSDFDSKSPTQIQWMDGKVQTLG